MSRLTNDEVFDLFRKGKNGRSYNGHGSVESRDGVLYHWRCLEAIKTHSGQFIINSEHASTSWSPHFYITGGIYLPLYSIVGHLGITPSEINPDTIEMVSHNRSGSRDITKFNISKSASKVKLIRYNEELPNRGVEIVREILDDGSMDGGIAIYYRGWSRKVDDYNSYLRFKERSIKRFTSFWKSTRLGMSASESKRIKKKLSILIKHSNKEYHYRPDVVFRNSHILIYSSRGEVVKFNKSLQTIDGHTALKISIGKRNSPDTYRDSQHLIIRGVNGVHISRIRGLECGYKLSTLVKKEIENCTLYK